MLDSNLELFQGPFIEACSVGIGSPDKRKRGYGQYDAGNLVYFIHTVRPYHIF